MYKRRIRNFLFSVLGYRIISKRGDFTLAYHFRKAKFCLLYCYVVIKEYRDLLEAKFDWSIMSGGFGDVVLESD